MCQDRSATIRRGGVYVGDYYVGVRPDEANGAVQMLAVIPTDEGFHPSLCLCFCGKPIGWPVRTVFAGPQPSFGERITVADAWPAVGRGDAQFLHRHLHSCPFHRTAVVRVQNQRAHDAALGQNGLSDQRRR